MVVVIVRLNCRWTPLRSLLGCDFYRRGRVDCFAAFACGFGVSFGARVADVFIMLALRTNVSAPDVVARCRIFIADVSDC